jgi:KDO2-lipid IV(A) lauroyltransferase
LDLPLQWDGLNHVTDALQQGRGMILLSPHLGCWELGAQMMAEHLGPAHGSMWVMYRPARKAWLRDLVAGARDRPFLQAAPANQSGVRQLLRSLRQGGYTAVLPDQVPPEGQGLWTTFFGRPVYTMNLLPKLAQQTGAVVLLAWCERHTGGQFTFHVLPPCLQALNQPQTTPEQAALLMNQAIERMVLSRPDQYLWGYARDKQPRAGD